MRKIMNVVPFVLSLCFCAASLGAREANELGRLLEICHASFPTITQDGEMEASLIVCALESNHGRGGSLYIVIAYEREIPTRIDRILELSHSPSIEKKGNEISILYTSGVNTTCVTTYTIKNSHAEYSSTETIAWNDHGIFKTSKSFEKYAHLYEENMKHDHSTESAPGAVHFEVK